MNPPRLARPMTSPIPRLLVALSPRDEVDAALAQRLPDLPWSYASRSAPADWAEVEAVLVGSVERELGDFTAARTPKLAFVQGVYTGLDGFPFERFPEPIRVAGNIGAFAPFVAEHAVALALAAARAIVPAQAKVRAGELRPPPEQRVLFRGTALVLGFGEIGREVAVRLAGFGMRVVGLNRTGRMAPDCEAMYPADRLREALLDADLVVDVRPLTRATAGSVGASELAAMRPEAIYVNVGRAGTVDPAALYRHLVDRPGFRAALDVWWEEDFAAGRFPVRFPFSDLPNFVGTPHCAGLGPGSSAYVLDRAVANLARFFRGEPVLHVADRRDYLP